GTFQAYVDERATEEQRTALLTIMSGKAADAWVEVLASVVSTTLKPKLVKIEWEFDLAKRTARAAIPGELETVSEPIRNLATGDAHRALTDMPPGIAYTERAPAT